MGKAQERRRRIRVPLTQTIRHSKYQVLGTPVFEENSSVDLSSGGISFETSEQYAIGTLVLLEVSIDDQMVKLLVCVAWVKPHDGRYTTGSELIAIDPEHKKSMQVHLNRLIRSFEPRKKKKPTGKSKKTTLSKKWPKKTTSKKPTLKKKSAKKIAKKKTKKTVLRKKVRSKKRA